MSEELEWLMTQLEFLHTNAHYTVSNLAPHEGMAVSNEFPSVAWLVPKTTCSHIQCSFYFIIFPVFVACSFANDDPDTLHLRVTKYH